MHKARLMKGLTERECAERNALTKTDRTTPSALPVGTVGTVLDTLEDGHAFVVEFGSRGPDQCDWLGVLYVSELQFMPDALAAQMPDNRAGCDAADATLSAA